MRITLFVLAIAVTFAIVAAGAVKLTNAERAVCADGRATYTATGKNGIRYEAKC